jgi:hypothetical protein
MNDDAHPLALKLSHDLTAISSRREYLQAANESLSSLIPADSLGWVGPIYRRVRSKLSAPATPDAPISWTRWPEPHSTRTVRKHIEHIYFKLNQHDRYRAVQEAGRRGLLVSPRGL